MCCLISTGYGQKGKVKQQIEAARIALITERLNLTPAEAEKFWPVYNEFTAERRALRMDFKEERNKINSEELSDDQRKVILEREINLKQQEIDLEKKYSQKVLDVISTKQMMSLRTAERDFKRMLLDRVKRSRGQQMQRQPMKQKEQVRKKNNND
jgi:hypothetical protein